MRRAVIVTGAGGGTINCWPVDVLKETPQNFRVRLRRKTKIGDRWWPRGTVKLAPKFAVSFTLKPGHHL